MSEPILHEHGDRISGPSSNLRLPDLLRERVARLMSPGLEVQPNVPDSESARLLKNAIIDVARALNRPGWSAYLVGGTLRDILLAPDDVAPDEDHQFTPRDIDIIVCGAAREELKQLLESQLVLERLTRFGGLHLSKPLSSGARILFDVWTLADTWGFSSQQIPPRIEDFPGTTFLNIDSCAFELLPPPGKPSQCFEKGFFASLTERVLDINYAPNPHPYVCVARSLLIAARLDFTLTRALAEFILTYSASGGTGALIEAQQSHYGLVRSTAPELDAWLGLIRRQFESRQPAIRLEVTEARRQELWRDYPQSGGRSQPSPPTT